jgi:ubiquinone/menaquinone biosynthesis C-methylase UbiE
MDNWDWHERFTVQAGWTKQLRQYLYQQVGLNEKSRILEIGCGTGVITSELKGYSSFQISGIDIQFDRLEVAKTKDNLSNYDCGDVYHLPYSNNSFDFVVSHYLFLWLQEPVQALTEIMRVLKPGGQVIALAEPDYLARIDSPKELWTLGELQTKALIQQGANPMAGRLLASQLTQAGFVDIQYGISGFQEKAGEIPEWVESEWKTLEHDLASLVPLLELNELHKQDLAALQNGSRIRWIPTFYCFGKKYY